MLGPATSSGVKSASAVIAAMPAKVCSVMLVGGSAASTLILYDNATTGSGLELATLSAASGGYFNFDSSSGIVANKGIYGVLTGTGASFLVTYELSA